MKDWVLPQFPHEDVLDRNKMGGRNQRYIGNMCVVTIYQYWDDNYRVKLAKAMGLEHKNCIYADIFGDIGDLRNSIIHNGGEATDFSVSRSQPGFMRVSAQHPMKAILSQ